jgi:deferrochelatase/peroxidase EfeB
MTSGTIFVGLEFLHTDSRLTTNKTFKDTPMYKEDNLEHFASFFFLQHTKAGKIYQITIH